MRTFRVLILVLASGAAALGCWRSTGNFPRLSAVERARFQRCWGAVQPVMCGFRDRGTFYRENCRQRTKALYGDQPSARARRAFLIRYGCHPAIANAE